MRLRHPPHGPVANQTSREPRVRDVPGVPDRSEGSMTPYLDTWCMTCRTWHTSVWVHIGPRVVKVNDIDAPIMEAVK